MAGGNLPRLTAMGGVLTAHNKQRETAILNSPFSLASFTISNLITLAIKLSIAITI
jgi:hypothetical protein